MKNPESKEEIKFPAIAAQITAMVKVDQDMRLKLVDKTGPLDDSVDRQNTLQMKEIISRIGWPTISKVGKEASSGAWLLVQHADLDVAFQKQCLSLMKQEQPSEVSLHDIAYLEDRVRINSGQPQFYGTQFDLIHDRFIPKIIENPEEVEMRRKEMNLDTIAENVERMHQNYKVERPKE